MAVNFLIYRNIADTEAAPPSANDADAAAPPPHLHPASATVDRRCCCSAGRPHTFSAQPDGLSPLHVRIEVGCSSGARSGYCGVVYFDVPHAARAAAGDCRDNDDDNGFGPGGDSDPQPPRPQRWQRYLSADAPLELSFGPSPFGTRPWEFVCCLFTSADYVQLDCRLGGGAVPPHEDVLRPWQLAAQPVWCAGLEELLLRGVAEAPRLRDAAGGTPLHRACTGPHKGALGFVKALVRKAGADCAARDDGGRTALHWAAAFGDEGSGSSGGGGGGGGVVSATEYGRAVDVLSFLVDEAGVDLRAVDACGETALHCAARCDVEPCSMVTTLLRGGACTSVVDVRGLTPLGAARSLGAFHTASALELWRPGGRGGAGAPRPKEGGVPKRQLVEAFAAFDKNKTGFIGYSDFKHLEQRFINEYGIGVGANLIQSAISKYGLLVDGKLSYNAFAMLITLIP